MIFKVLTGNGYSYNASAGGLPSARQMQRLSDRRAILAGLPTQWIDMDEDNLYDMVISMPEGPDKEQAIAQLEAERALPEYWYGEDKPRYPVNSSSSWVRNIEYDPKSELLTMGNTAVFATPEEVAEVLNGTYSTGNGSVGRSLINLWRNKGWGKNAGKGPLP